MNVGIVGLGLIGGSFAKGYRKNAPDCVIYADNRTAAVTEKAIADGVVNAPMDEENIALCDIIIISLFTDAAVKWLTAHKDLISGSTVVVDACGIKRRMCAEGYALSKSGKNGFRFIGGHPMAGTEKAGYDNSLEDLYAGASMILVPEDENDTELIGRAKELLSPLKFGMFVITDPDHHDRMIAYTSQMMHVMANSIVKNDKCEYVPGFTGGSFQDMTRVAFLNPSMWTELFMNNKDYLLEDIATEIEELNKYAEAIRTGDEDTLMKLLDEGRKRREALDIGR
ncbi:MAG: prephenate dehydrogenase/arogenate dehydrogenase family protein [Clostridiales bacterium]|nr:prephenate dehydrogenase/arogenate dehydrogenase family protein [Clostridiales bacterium]